MKLSLIEITNGILGDPHNETGTNDLITKTYACLAYSLKPMWVRTQRQNAKVKIDRKEFLPHTQETSDMVSRFCHRRNGILQICSLLQWDTIRPTERSSSGNHHLKQDIPKHPPNLEPRRIPICCRQRNTDVYERCHIRQKHRAAGREPDLGYIRHHRPAFTSQQHRQIHEDYCRSNAHSCTTVLVPKVLDGESKHAFG